MTQYNKYDLIYHLQRWMDSVPGQTFLNYGYSWGASVVILGALFKLTHLPGANIMLYFGMDAEVIVFFLSAFGRPFDKTDDGRELPTHVTEELLDDNENTVERPATAPQAQYAAAENIAQSVQEAMPSTNDIAAVVVSQQSKAIADAQQQAPEMVEAQTNYVAALQNLTEMLGKVNDQSQRLTRDSEEMESLNRTLTGITKVYEMQLKNASQRIGTVSQINDQTRKVAQQIEQLNSIYARMIEAMTVNIRVAAPSVAPQRSTPKSL